MYFRRYTDNTVSLLFILISVSLQSQQVALITSFSVIMGSVSMRNERVTVLTIVTMLLMRKTVVCPR